MTARAAPRVAAASASTLYAKLVLVALFWGGTYVAGRAITQALPNFTTATLRFALATAILVTLAYTYEGGLPKLNPRRFVAMLALAATGVFLFNACFFAALERIPASRGALIMSLNPIAVALGAWLVFRETLRPMRAFGIVLALLGAAIVVTHGALPAIAHAFGPGDWLMLGSVLAWMGYTLIGRAVLRGMSPLGAITWAALLGTVMLAVAALFERPWSALAALPASAWGTVAYLGCFGTVFPFLWYYQGVQRLGPSRAAIFTNLVPVFGVALAALILGEPVPASYVVGGAIVIAGVVLTNRPATRARSASTLPLDL